MTTMSLRLIAGTRDCSTYARNVFPFIEPSITHGAVLRVRRRPATKVRVFQCPCGTQPTGRAPRGHRPLSRTIFLLAAVSSMNTSRVELSMACRRFQHRRARATSGRSCSAARRLFFEADVVALEEAPHGSATACNPVLVHHRDHLIQRQIRLLLNQREQPRRMCLQWRRAPAARFGCTTPSLVKALHPFDCCTWADVELLGCLTSRSPAFDVCDHQHANVRRICLRHRSPPDESMPPDSPIYRSLGILRFYSARTCSSSCCTPTHAKWRTRLSAPATETLIGKYRFVGGHIRRLHRRYHLPIADPDTVANISFDIGVTGRRAAQSCILGLSPWSWDLKSQRTKW